MTLLNPIVLDGSRWQSLINENTGEVIKWWDFEKAYEAGARVVFLRATVGDYYKDICFEGYWERAKATGLKVASYHVYMPATVDGRKISAEAQMEKYFRAMDGKEPDWYPVLDCEKNRKQSKRYITDGIVECLHTLDLGFDNSLIYTRGNWWQNNVERSDGFSHWDLFIARYKPGLEHPWEDDPNTDPLDWEDWEWDVWQHSADGNGRGEEFGAASRSIDISRVNDPNYFNLDFDNGDEPMPNDLENFLKLMEKYEIKTTANIDYISVGELPDNGNGGNGNDPPDEPLPDGAVQMKVYSSDPERHWTSAWGVSGTNDAGNLILYKYKKPNGSVLRIPNDAMVWVSGEKFGVDGSFDFEKNLGHEWYDHDQGDVRLILDRGHLNKV